MTIPTLIEGDCATAAKADEGYTIVPPKAHKPSIAEKINCFFILNGIKFKFFNKPIRLF